MSLEMNKVAAAVLTGGIVAMLSGFVAGKLYHPETLEEPAYKIALPDTGGEKEKAPKEESILPLIASADVEAGKKQTSKCSACHTFTEGGANGVGPNLWGIVGSEPASVAGFSFSDALQNLKSEGKKWDYKDLDAFLADPKGYAPGTKMAFAGLRKIDQRADVIAYLRTLSTSPVPLPSKEETEKADGDDTKKTEAEGASSDATETASAEAPKAEETKAAEEPKAEETTAAATPKAEDKAAAEDAPKAEDKAAAEEAPKTEEAATAAADAPKADEGDTAAAAAPKAEESKSASAEAPKADEKAAAEAPKEEQVAAAPAAAGGESESELGKLLAGADIDKGKKVARKCTACHTFDEGGKNRVGPNLYGIIGKTAGEGEGYKFSKAMAAKGAEGYTWTYQHLDDYLANPRKAIPGNKMTFPGLKKPQDRADVIAYIRSLAKDPPPLPN